MEHFCTICSLHLHLSEVVHSSLSLHSVGVTTFSLILRPHKICTMLCSVTVLCGTNQGLERDFFYMQLLPFLVLNRTLQFKNKV